MRHSITRVRRQGMAIVAAMVLMAVLTIILSIVTLEVVAQRKLVNQRQRQLQAQWLARAGVEIAAARLLETPSAFSDDKQSLLPDTKLAIAVEKSGADAYAVSVEAQVGSKEEQPVVRSAHAHFRRTEKGGVVRLISISARAAPSDK